MKALLAAAGAALLIAGCASTEPPPSPPSAVAANGMPIMAPGYLAMASSADMFEIQSGQLAMQRSANPSVQSFGQMLVSDHTGTSSDLMAAASSAGVPPPPSQMLPQHADMLRRLQAAGPAGFDTMFRDEQISAHQQGLMLHRTYAEQGDVPALRSAAAGIVPVVQAHLDQAQALSTMTPPARSPRRAGERG